MIKIPSQYNSLRLRILTLRISLSRLTSLGLFIHLRKFFINILDLFRKHWLHCILILLRLYRPLGTVQYQKLILLTGFNLLRSFPKLLRQLGSKNNIIDHLLRLPTKSVSTLLLKLSGKNQLSRCTSFRQAAQKAIGQVLYVGRDENVFRLQKSEQLNQCLLSALFVICLVRKF